MAFPSEHQGIYDELVSLLSSRHPHLLQPFLRLADAVASDRRPGRSEGDHLRYAAEYQMNRAQELERELAEERDVVEELRSACVNLTKRRTT